MIVKMSPPVIELLSSSAPPSPASTKPLPVPNATRTTLHELLDLGSDDFDDKSSLDFEIDRPTKRPRLNPAHISTSKDKGKQKNPASKLGAKFAVDFDIFSDDDAGRKVEHKHLTNAFQESLKHRGKSNINDEITYSSSAPEPSLPGARKKVDVDTATFLLDHFFEDDSLDDLPTRLSQPASINYDDRTARLLASLDQKPNNRAKPKSLPFGSRSHRDLKGKKTAAKVVDDIDFSSSPVKARQAKHSKSSETEKAAKVAERATARADKEAAKEAAKARKQVEKEQKQKEKQKAADLAEVNKSRTNKKDATPEMILDMSSFLRDTSVGNQVEERMKTVQVEVNYIDEEVNLTDGSVEPDQYGNIITWRRKVKSTYNDEDARWEPTSRCRIVKESHVLIHLPAEEFAAVVAVSRSGSSAKVLRTEEEMKSNLDAHILGIRRRFGDCVPIYLIEGFRSWIKKNLNAKNRAYTAAVRAQILDSDANAESATSQARGRKRKKTGADSLDLSHVTADVVDDLLLHLQLSHRPIMIHHASAPEDSASQISAFTQHLATRPYRLAQLDHNLKSASFCMDSGQVRTGDDAKDTFVKMLQEVQRVTPSMAYGIVEEYKTIRKLVKGFDKHGNMLLEDVRKTVNKDGAWSDKRLGPQVSRRLFKVFMGRDPTSTDGMS